MNELLLAALLSAASPAAPCCTRPAVALMEVDNAKEAKDQVGHFISPMVLTTSFYGTAMYLGAERKQARWIAAAMSIGLIVAKEVYDDSVAGRFGLEETGIGIAGTAAGIYLSERITWR